MQEEFGKAGMRPTQITYERTKIAPAARKELVAIEQLEFLVEHVSTEHPPSILSPGGTAYVYCGCPLCLRLIRVIAALLEPFEEPPAAVAVTEKVTVIDESAFFKP